MTAGRPVRAFGDGALVVDVDGVDEAHQVAVVVGESG
jgi:hypothetical protein